MKKLILIFLLFNVICIISFSAQAQQKIAPFTLQKSELSFPIETWKLYPYSESSSENVSLLSCSLYIDSLDVTEWSNNYSFLEARVVHAPFEELNIVDSGAIGYSVEVMFRKETLAGLDTTWLLFWINNSLSNDTMIYIYGDFWPASLELPHQFDIGARITVFNFDTGVLYALYHSDFEAVNVPVVTNVPEMKLRQKGANVVSWNSNDILMLYNMNGKLVRQSQGTLSVENLPNGIYIVRIDGTSHAHKISIAR